jgi:hypothetical protein
MAICKPTSSAQLLPSAEEETKQGFIMGALERREGFWRSVNAREREWVVGREGGGGLQQPAMRRYPWRRSDELEEEGRRHC